MSKDVAVNQETQVASPNDLMQLAIEKGADLSQLEKLLEISIKVDANKAKKAYVVSMSAFKENPPKVTKDKVNKQYNSKYCSLENLVNTVNPVLSSHGLSARWDIKQNGIIEVSCTITHHQGHSESASATAPADISGAKNAIQQIKSTITYLKSVTFESILGLAATDANCDDDGNSAGNEYITAEEARNIDKLVTEANADPVKVLKIAKADTYNEILVKDYNNIVQILKNNKKNAGGTK